MREILPQGLFIEHNHLIDEGALAYMRVTIDPNAMMLSHNYRKSEARAFAAKYLELLQKKLVLPDGFEIKHSPLHDVEGRTPIEKTELLLTKHYDKEAGWMGHAEWEKSDKKTRETWGNTHHAAVVADGRKIQKAFNAAHEAIVAAISEPEIHGADGKPLKSAQFEVGKDGHAATLPPSARRAAGL